MSRSVTTAALVLTATVLMLVAGLGTGAVGIASGDDLPPPDSPPTLRKLSALRLSATVPARLALWDARRAEEAAAEAAAAARRAAARRAAAARADAVVTTTVPAQGGDGSYLGEFTVTCYALQGTTASGRPVGPEVVAVDPRVIPLGTWIHIEGVGNRQASDTGGDVKGKRLDIWHESRDWCIQFGRRVLSVHRL